MRKSVIDCWIDPWLARRHVGPLLTKNGVKEFRNEIVAAGSGNDRANNAIALLSAFFGWLVESERIDHNPCSRLKKLPVLSDGHIALQPDGVEAIRAEMAPRDALLVSLMAYSGLRPSEAFALRRDRVTPGTILVDRSYVSGQLKVTKTGSQRVVAVVEPLAEDIAEWLALQSDVDPRSPLCPGRGGGPLDLSNWRARIWSPAAQRAGVEATPYDLRHTFCSLLAHEGRPMHYIASQMGHSLMETQTRYTHILAGAKFAVNRPMADAIAEARVRLVCDEATDREDAHLAEVIDLQAFRKAGAAGIEPATLSLEGSCSIH